LLRLRLRLLHFTGGCSALQHFNSGCRCNERDVDWSSTSRVKLLLHEEHCRMQLEALGDTASSLPSRFAEIHTDYTLRPLPQAGEEHRLVRLHE
tara:strand:+ start:179 stop:460 length:282 start_codon:yes stop_codon:yes gene_type:complete